MDQINDAANGSRISTAFFFGLPALLLVIIFIKTVGPHLISDKSTIWGWSLIIGAALIVKTVIAFNFRQRTSDIYSENIIIIDRWLGIKLQTRELQIKLLSDVSIDSYAAGFTGKKYYSLKITDEKGRNYVLSSSDNEKTIQVEREKIKWPP